MKYLFIFFFGCLFISVQAQDLVLRKGGKTRVFDNGKLHVIKGYTADISKFYYTAYVIDSDTDSLTLRLKSSTEYYDTDTGEERRRNQYKSYTNAPDIRIAKADIRQVKTKFQSKTGGQIALAGLVTIAAGIGTVIYGAIGNDERASLIGFGGMAGGLSMILIATKMKYKVVSSEDIGKGWRVI